MSDFSFRRTYALAVAPTLRVVPSRWVSGAVLLAALSLLGSWQHPAVGQSSPTQPSGFPALDNPLEPDPSDPLLPNLIVDRPLSLQEQQALRASLNQLQREGQRQYDAGNIPRAFEIWLRELQLRRVLGIQEEVPALSRVGDLAWQENQTLEIRAISDRLEEIEQQIRAQPTPDYGLLLQVADAYKTLRSRDQAIAAYLSIVQDARQRQDKTTEAAALEALGEVHLAWFNYDQAAPVYENLLVLRQSQQDAVGEQQALLRLATIYDETERASDAVATRQRLVKRYRETGELTQVPPLKIAIAAGFQQMGRLNAAVRNYQEAIAAAQAVGYVGYAADAARGLAELYLSVDRPQDALTVYRLLVDIQRQAYNTYGEMEAHDQIGQIHRSRGETEQAIASFRRGLTLAQQLSYRTEYFNEQIRLLSTGSGG
ncbi:MAG: tetratricopeptide repeat protein [Elainellaceae cyanobacterium]